MFRNYSWPTRLIFINIDAKNIREILKNQEILLQREDTLEEMKEMVMNLHKFAESNVYFLPLTP